MEGGTANMATSMGTVVSSLISELSPANLWGVIGAVVPIIGVTVLFALGFWLAKKAVKKLSKAKAGV